MSKDVKNVPALRFRGYSDAWEKRKLREVSDVRDGTHASPKYYSQGYPLVTSKNLTSAGLDFSNISLISELDYKNINKRSRVDKGDILFGMIGTIGTPVMVHESNFAIKNVALIKEREAVLNSFLVQLLKSPAFINYIRNENVGGTQKFLSLNTIRNFRFSFPTSKEQAMVSRFLEKIDSLIAATQDKIDILEQISLALKRHLYNHSWSFKDEDEPWIIQTLNNSTSKIKSYSLIRSVETLTNTGYKYIHYGDIHTGKVTLINSVETLPNIPAGNYELLSKGDLILADASEDYKGIADAAILLDTDDQRVVAGLHTIALRPQNTDPVFLYYLFQTEKFKTFARKMGTGLKVFGISYSNLVRFKFASPSKTLEQQRIGNLLLTIENLLRATTTSLKALRSVKQSLLQNLFM